MPFVPRRLFPNHTVDDKMEVAAASIRLKLNFFYNFKIKYVLEAIKESSWIFQALWKVTSTWKSDLVYWCTCCILHIASYTLICTIVCGEWHGGLDTVRTVQTLLVCLPQTLEPISFQLQRWRHHLTQCITFVFEPSGDGAHLVFMCQIELCDLEFGGRHQSYA